jgi:chromate transporter
MERDLVEDRTWLTREEFLRGLALSQLAPGPLAAQLAMYVGYVRDGILGATVTGILFVLPSFIMVLALGMIYAAYGGLDWMQAAFYGIGAAVIGIIVKSAYKLARVTLKKKALLWGIFAVMCAVTAITERENILLFLLSGVVTLFFFAPPARLKLGAAQILVAAPLQLAPGIDWSRWSEIFLFFAKAGVFVFGSGLAIVPFLHGSVVQQYHWLNERQFLDSVAVAMITPGPVVITVGFIGYLVGNTGGAIAAALGVFLPVWLVVVLVTPFYQRVAANLQVQAFVQGVTSAATGAIAGAVIVLSRRAVVDLPTLLVAAGTLLLLIRYKIPEPVLVFCAGLIGLILFKLR